MLWFGFALASCTLSEQPPIGAEPRTSPGASVDVQMREDKDNEPELEAFVRQIAADANLTWADDFRRREKPFTAAQPAFYASGSAPRCAIASRESCTPRETAFFDLTLQELLSRRFGAESAPVRAYAVAHEMGHHVQRVLGVDTEVQRLLADRPIAAHAVRIQLELQADCLAGVWARSSRSGSRLEAGQIELTLRRASEVGAERRTMKRDPEERTPESFTYAVPRQRIFWFARGFAQGRIEDCDTFAP